MSKDEKYTSTSEYWNGAGRKLIVIPKKLIREKTAISINHLYISELGYYPAADKHETVRKNGCPEMVILLCIRGKGSYMTRFENHQVLPGQYFILFPNEQHQYEADKFDPWSIYWLKINGADLTKFCQQASLKKCRKPVYVMDLVEVRRLFDDLIEILESGYSHERMMYANMTLQRILALMIYFVEETKKESKRLSDSVIKFMKEYISDKYTLAELALKFNYSTSQFSNIFKKETGYSPIDYFIQLKIQQACKMLHSTDLKVYQVAIEVGYKDPYHFSKLFKMIMDISPEHYRALISK